MEALTTSQNEVKALQAKLAATRAATASVEPASAFGRATGAAANGKGPAARTMMGNAEAVMAAQVAQLKENMYSDLTGLIMRNVDRQDDGDIYDCIQTGRNGSKSIIPGTVTSLANDWFSAPFQACRPQRRWHVI